MRYGRRKSKITMWHCSSCKHNWMYKTKKCQFCGDPVKKFMRETGYVPQIERELQPLKHLLLIAALIIVFSSMPAYADNIILQVNRTEIISDTWVQLSDPTLNAGARNDLGSGPTRDVEVSRAYIMISLTNLTSLGATSQNITSAYLRLTDRTNHSSLSNHSVYHVFLANWSDAPTNNVGWNNQPCGTAYQAITDATRCNLTAEDTVYNYTGAQDIVFNVSKMVGVALDNGWKNVSIMITFKNGTASSVNEGNYFNSKDQGTQALNPMLNITFGSPPVGNTAPNITIVSPLNSSYLSNNVLLNFTPTDAQNTSMNCWYGLDNAALVNLGSIANNTANVTNLTNLYHGTHNVTVTCEDTAPTRLNTTTTVWFTMLHYNVTYEAWTENATETDQTYYVLNVSFANNVQSLNATIRQNNTVYGPLITQNSNIYSFIYATTLPLVVNNRTAIYFNWTYNVSYINGSNISVLSNTRFNNLSWAFTLNALTQNNTIRVEGSWMNITADVSTLLPRVNNNRTVTISVNLTINNTINTTMLLFNTSSFEYYNFSFYAAQVNGVQNLTFLYNGTVFITYGGITRSQNVIGYVFYVDNINFTSCTGGVYALNFTFFNERSQTTRTGNNSIAIDIQAWYQNNSFFGNFSFNVTSATTEPISICITPSYSTIHVNATVIYSSSGFWQRNYYLVNAPLSNVTTTVSLFVLNNTISGLTRIYVESSIGNPLAGRFVLAQRYYPETAASGAYQTVAMIKTADLTGDALTYLEYDNAFYRFVVLAGNTIIASFSNRQITLESSLDTFANVNLRTSTATGEYYSYVKGTLVAFSCTVNNNTAVVSCSVTDTSGLLASSNLSLTRNISLTPVILCSVYSTTSGALLTCNTSSYGSGVYRYTLKATSSSGTTYTLQIGQFNYGVTPQFGSTGLLIFIFFLMIFAFAGLWNFYVGMGLMAVGTVLGFMAIGAWEIMFTGLVSILLVIFIFIIKEKRGGG